MLKFTENKITFDYSRCQQCGACGAVCPKGAIAFTMRGDATHDVVVDDAKCIRCQRCVRVCPANKETAFIRCGGLTVSRLPRASSTLRTIFLIMRICPIRFTTRSLRAAI